MKEEIAPEIVKFIKPDLCYTLISPGLWKCCKKSVGAPIGQCLFLLKVAEKMNSYRCARNQYSVGGGCH